MGVIAKRSSSYGQDATTGDGHASPIEKALSDALEVWATWSKLGAALGEGYPGGSPMFRGAYHAIDWQSWEEDADHDTAMAVQVAVWDLEARERRAVLVTKLGGVWDEAADGPLVEVYLRARGLLLDVLVRRGVITA